MEKLDKVTHLEIQNLKLRYDLSVIQALTFKENLERAVLDIFVERKLDLEKYSLNIETGEFVEKKE